MIIGVNPGDNVHNDILLRADYLKEFIEKNHKQVKECISANNLEKLLDSILVNGNGFEKYFIMTSFIYLMAKVNLVLSNNFKFKIEESNVVHEVLGSLSYFNLHLDIVDFESENFDSYYDCKIDELLVTIPQNTTLSTHLDETDCISLFRCIVEELKIINYGPEINISEKKLKELFIDEDYLFIINKINIIEK